MIEEKCPKCNSDIDLCPTLTISGIFRVHLCTNCCYCYAERSEENAKLRLQGDEAIFDIGEDGEHE